MLSIPRIRTRHVAAASVGFLGGVGAASAAYASGVVVPWAFMIAAGVSGVSAASMARGRRRAVAVIAIIGFILGAARFTATARAAVAAPIPDRAEVTVTGTARSIREVAGGRLRIRLGDPHLQVGSGRRTPVITTSRPLDLLTLAADQPSYGDALRVRCRFAAPMTPRDRLRTAGTCHVARGSDLQVTAMSGGSPIIRSLLAFRDHLVAVLDHTLPEPAATVTGGILLGLDRPLDTDLTAAFRDTGTIHILVVSGWHMVFIGLRLRRWITALFGIPRRAALILTLMLVAAFTAMVGASASALRGAMLVALLVAVDLMGRIGAPARLLLLVATAMVAIHPVILAFDLGAQLSFAAAGGLLLLQPIIDRACDRIWVPRRRLTIELRDLLTSSTAASLATAPLLAYAFGTIAPWSVLVNIPVLLLVPGMMVTGAALIILAATPLLSVAAAAVTAIASALVAVVQRTAELPWTPLTTARPHGWFIAATYLLLVTAVIAWHRQRGIPLLLPVPVTASTTTPHA